VKVVTTGTTIKDTIDGMKKYTATDAARDTKNNPQ
jgi:orotate phosphoribosyltransferase-like protein